VTEPTCGCCSGVQASTPRPVRNRPGLTAIDVRVGRHADFLASMVARLTSAARPALRQLSTREDDDFTVALLDGWAVVADVLTFYTERLATEAYLRTATERASLQELGKLIGYRLDPGAAAETHLAFAVERPPPAAPGQSADPGTAPPVTASEVLLPGHLRVQSIPGPGQRPQTFETTSPIVARPAWNAFGAATTLPTSPQLGDTSAWLEGATLVLQPGDVLLLVGTDVLNDRWDVRTLSAVTADTAVGCTEVRWTEPLGSLSPPKLPAAQPDAFVLRKRLHPFGHNAPAWRAMSQQFKDEYTGTSNTTANAWPDFDLSPESGPVVDLAGSHPDVVAGSWVVLTLDDDAELWKVDRVTELARADFALSGPVTRLHLAGGENFDHFSDRVRDTTVFAVSEALTLAEVPDPSAIAGDAITVTTDVGEMEPGRRVVVTGTTTGGLQASEVAVVETVTATGGRWHMGLERALTASFERTSVVVHGNIAHATHGETVDELLGSGRANQPFQRFGLARASLTYVQSGSATGTTSTLCVRVNGVEWTEAATLFGAPPDARRYTVRPDANGRQEVRFGDGIAGARLPTGNQNVVAEYRHGIGVAGNVAAGSLAQLIDRPLGAKGVSNPAAADGGVDPERAEAARSSLPLKVRTLGRAVSLLDYADFTRAFTGVSKAHAAVLPLLGTRTVVVTVAFTPGTTKDPTLRIADLTTALRSSGDPHVAVRVLDHDELTFRLAARVVVDPARDADVVLTAVRTAVDDAFAFERRDLTSPLHLSQVVSVVHRVDGVVAVDVDRFYTGATPALEDVLLAQLPAVTTAGAPLPAGLLVIDADPFDALDAAT
jgi:predicted phage baseplate assembly protein